MKTTDDANGQDGDKNCHMGDVNCQLRAGLRAPQAQKAMAQMLHAIKAGTRTSSKQER